MNSKELDDYYDFMTVLHNKLIDIREGYSSDVKMADDLGMKKQQLFIIMDSRTSPSAKAYFSWLEMLGYEVNVTVNIKDKR